MLGWGRAGETKTKTKTFPPPPLPTTKSAFPSVTCLSNLCGHPRTLTMPNCKRCIAAIQKNNILVSVTRLYGLSVKDRPNMAGACSERVLRCHHPGLAPSPCLLRLCPPHWDKPAGGMYCSWLLLPCGHQKHTDSWRGGHVFILCTHGLQDKSCTIENPWSPAVALCTSALPFALDLH